MIRLRIGEAPRQRLGAVAVLADDEALLAHARVEALVAARVDDVEAGRDDADRQSARVERSGVGGAVDADREPADHGDAGAGAERGDLARVGDAHRRRGASADDRDPRRVERAGPVALAEEHARHPGVDHRVEEVGVADREVVAAHPTMRLAAHQRSSRIHAARSTSPAAISVAIVEVGDRARDAADAGRPASGQLANPALSEPGVACGVAERQVSLQRAGRDVGVAAPRCVPEPSLLAGDRRDHACGDDLRRFARLGSGLLHLDAQVEPVEQRRREPPRVARCAARRRTCTRPPCGRTGTGSHTRPTRNRPGTRSFPRRGSRARRAPRAAGATTRARAPGTPAARRERARPDARG